MLRFQVNLTIAALTALVTVFVDLPAMGQTRANFELYVVQQLPDEPLADVALRRVRALAPGGASLPDHFEIDEIRGGVAVTSIFEVSEILVQPNWEIRYSGKETDVDLEHRRSLLLRGTSISLFAHHYPWTVSVSDPTSGYHNFGATERQVQPLLNAIKCRYAPDQGSGTLEIELLSAVNTRCASNETFVKIEGDVQNHGVRVAACALHAGTASSIGDHELYAIGVDRNRFDALTLSRIDLGAGYHTEIGSLSFAFAGRQYYKLPLICE